MPTTPETFDQEFFGIVEHDALNQAAIDQVMSLQNFDVLGNLSADQSDPLDVARAERAFHAINAVNVSAEDLSYEGLAASIARAEREAEIEAQVAAFRDQMDRHNIIDQITGDSDSNTKSKKLAKV